jgi:hypothetical protein
VPHVVAWNKLYSKLGLEVIGVHSPEYAFEKVPANVMHGAAALGITYPVAIDNNLSTWTNYRNRYWPADYLIDSKGVVRNVQFGEGDYGQTEDMIRQLLTQANPGVTLPAPSDLPDTTPKTSTTPETYLGSTKDVNYGGTEKYSAETPTFTVPKKLAANSFALDGSWNLSPQYIETTAAGGAGIRLNYTASEVRMVLGGSGTVSYSAGGTTKTIHVSGTPRSYELLRTSSTDSGALTVKVGPGVQAYSFTFG